MQRLFTILTLASFLLLSASAFGQSRQIPAPAQSQPIIVHDAMIHPVDAAVIEQGYVIFDEGRIIAIGAMPLPREWRNRENVQRIDARDLHVYPGLIANNTQVGLQEVSAVAVTVDHTERGEFTPEVRAAVAVNPDSELFPVARHNGILIGGVFPRGGLISGHGSIMRFDGWTWEDMAIRSSAGLVINWPRTEPISARWMDQSENEQRRQIAERFQRIEDFFDEAETYLAAREHDESLTIDQRFEGMRAALAGEQPVFFRASTIGQMQSAIAFSQRRGLKPIIVGGHDADRIADWLAELDVPVIIDGLHRLPRNRHDDFDRIYRLPQVLKEAGVRYAIASGAEPAHERFLNHNAATAAAYGLDRDEALRAVTLSAAEILGIDDDYGSLETEKSATLIITTGNPLEITTDTLVAFIDGRQIDLGNRQVAMFEKYREKYRQLGLLEEE
ncbi:MAG: imidazolonepropionase [Phycisphaerales bacterium]|nr:MAG: imidazolonepropionase [Phycisphaerales bacterium]